MGLSTATPTIRPRRPGRRLRQLSLAVSALGVILLALAALMAQAGLLAKPTAALGGMLALEICGLLALLLALAALWRYRAAWTGWLALIIAVVLVVPPLYNFAIATSVPAIHDISTDLVDPPTFVALVPVRAADDANPLDRDQAVAAAQAAGYPDLHSLTVNLPADAAFALALAAAEREGWHITAADPAAGRIEATAVTLLFGFRDDVVVRVQPVGNAQSRLDVRSVSRQGESDLGVNAARIHDYLHLLQQS